MPCGPSRPYCVTALSACLGMHGCSGPCPACPTVLGKMGLCALGGKYKNGNLLWRCQDTGSIIVQCTTNIVPRVRKIQSVSSLSMKYCVRAQSVRIVKPYVLAMPIRTAKSHVLHVRVYGECSRCSTRNVIGAADEYRSTCVLMRKI